MGKRRRTGSCVVCTTGLTAPPASAGFRRGFETVVQAGEPGGLNCRAKTGDPGGLCLAKGDWTCGTTCGCATCPNGTAFIPGVPWRGAGLGRSCWIFGSGPGDPNFSSRGIVVHVGLDGVGIKSSTLPPGRICGTLVTCPLVTTCGTGLLTCPGDSSPKDMGGMGLKE